MAHHQRYEKIADLKKEIVKGQDLEIPKNCFCLCRKAM